MSLVGSYVALSKPLVAAMPVFLLAWIRFGIGGLAMPHWLRPPADEAPMSAETMKLVFLESLLGNFLFSICMLYGMRMTQAVSAGAIMASIPAVVGLMSWLFLKEKISLRVGLAIVCAGAGILLFSLSKKELSIHAGISPEANLAYKDETIGNWLIFGAVLCEAAYAVIGKKLTDRLSPKRITALINLWGFALMTPMGLYLAWRFDFSSVQPGHWLLLLFYALAASVGTVWLWMSGLQTVETAKAGVFTVMLPISAAGVGIFVLDEKLSCIQFIAFGICLLGVLLATLPVKDSPSKNSLD